MKAFAGVDIPETLQDAVRPNRAALVVQIGIEPTVRHGSDLGFVPVVVSDACGAGHADAGERAMANMRFMGDAIVCTSDELKAAWGG